MRIQQRVGGVLSTGTTGTSLDYWDRSGLMGLALGREQGSWDGMDWRSRRIAKKPAWL